MSALINGVEISLAEKYRIVADFTLDWEEWRGPDWELLYISPSCERITGYPAQAFYADASFGNSIIHPEDRQYFLEHHGQDLQHPGSMHQMDYRIITRTGDERWISHFCQAIYHEDGTWLGRRISNREITGRKKAESELFQEKQQVEVFLKNIADSVVAMDPHGNIIYANQATVRVLGLDSPSSLKLFTQLRGRIQFLNEDGLPMNISSMPPEEAIMSLVKTPMTIQFHRLDTGTRGWFLVKTGPIYDENGNLMMVILIAQDITEFKRSQQDQKLIQADLEKRIEERTAAIRKINRDLRLEIAARKKIEQDLQKERDFSQSLINTAQVGLLVLDTHGKVVQINPFMEQLTKYTAEELTHKDWIEFVVPTEDIAKTKRSFENAIHDISTEGNITPIRTKDGQIRQVEWYDKTLKDLQGKTIGLLSIGQDVTERKQIEEKIIRNAALAEAVSNIAARLNAELDLNTLLNNICQEIVRAIPGLPSSSVLLLDEETDQLVIAATYGIYMDLIDDIMPIPRAILEQQYEKYGPIIVIPDLQGEDNFQSEHVNQTLQIRTTVTTLLHHQRRLIGILGLLSHKAPYIPSQEELSFIQAISEHATTAITNARLFQQISESQKRLQSLSQRLVEVQENERGRLARELHDEIGQVLTSLILTLDMIKNSCQVGMTKIDDVTKKLESAQEMVNYLLKQVRELALDLRPGLLDDFGLLPALLMHFDRYTELTKVEVNFKHSGIDRRFPSEIEITAFRLIQEALTNVARHAKVNQVQVRLWGTSDDLNIQVQDNGVGFNPAEMQNQNTRIGILGMEERVELCGGFLEIDSQPGNGTCLTIELPLSTTPGE